MGIAFIFRNSGLETRRYCLCSNDVFSLRTFLALSYSELNALTFGQGFEAGAGDCTEVCEDVWARSLLDKTKTFSFVEPLDSTGCSIRHNNILNIEILAVNSCE